jgi:site-specific recombinase XerD
MRRRVVARLRAQGRSAEADLVALVTPHWFRHNMATRMLVAGVDLKTIMQQGGWLTIESVIGYMHVPVDHQRAKVNLLIPPVTKLTRAINETEEK